jgi:hypothetical protein
MWLCAWTKGNHISPEISMLRCPTCDRPFDPAQSKAMPFCSERCRQIDLGRWLNEEHSLPWEPEDAADHPPPPAAEEE